MRSPNKTELVDFIIRAWNKISEAVSGDLRADDRKILESLRIGCKGKMDEYFDIETDRSEARLEGARKILIRDHESEKKRIQNWKKKKSLKNKS